MLTKLKERVMEKRINIAELLKDCPQGMELDCTMFDDVTLSEVRNHKFPIKIAIEGNRYRYLTETGGYDLIPKSKCVIFPKGKTTWEGFVPPCKFNDGDIVFTRTDALKCNLENCWVSIFKEYRNNRCACYVCVCLSDLELYHDKWGDELLCELCEIEENRLATDEEKQRLFQAIKDNGYKWNAETKVLEKLIEPKFKVGDKVREKGDEAAAFIISDIDNSCYYCGEYVICNICDQDCYELVPNKFDVNTLKPFESRVLVRDSEMGIWLPEFFGCLCDGNDCPYMIVGGTRWKCCIPYESNEHLLGTTDDCDDFYNTWFEG